MNVKIASLANIFRAINDVFLLKNCLIEFKHAIYSIHYLSSRYLYQFVVQTACGERFSKRFFFSNQIFPLF